MVKFIFLDFQALIYSLLNLNKNILSQLNGHASFIHAIYCLCLKKARSSDDVLLAVISYMTHEAHGFPQARHTLLYLYFCYTLILLGEDFGFRKNGSLNPRFAIKYMHIFLL